MVVEEDGDDVLGEDGGAVLEEDCDTAGSAVEHAVKANAATIKSTAAERTFI
ncbi:MAG: hypothetical protein ABI255_03375 [Microbacteriaceae bacterium]